MVTVADKPKSSDDAAQVAQAEIARVQANSKAASEEAKAAIAKSANVSAGKDNPQLAKLSSAPVDYASPTSQRTPLPEMRGRVNRHTSGYWALTIPALSVRYLAEAAANIFGLKRGRFANSKIPFLRKLATMNKGDSAHALDKIEAPIVGTFMMGVSSLYLYRTYQDIKSAFAESVAWETGKKPEDVGFMDLLKSDNTLVEAARHNFFKYNARRFAVNTPFFSRIAFKEHINADDAILLGTAANSLYLMSDVLYRKETFFERLQSFVDEKIQHTEQLGDKITAVDLINLYELHERDKNSHYKFNGRMDTKEWNDRTKIFGRMAKLMNETYSNEPNEEQADFTLSKMIYLMGHGMINSMNFERSMAYIEIANRNGIEAIKDVASHGVAGDADLKYAEQRYLNPSAEQPAPQAAAKFARDLSREAETSKMSNVDKQLARRSAGNDGTFLQTAL